MDACTSHWNLHVPAHGMNAEGWMLISWNHNQIRDKHSWNGKAYCWYKQDIHRVPLLLHNEVVRITFESVFNNFRMTFEWLLSDVWITVERLSNYFFWTPEKCYMNKKNLTENYTGVGHSYGHSFAKLCPKLCPVLGIVSGIVLQNYAQNYAQRLLILSSE